MENYEKYSSKAQALEKEVIEKITEKQEDCHNFMCFTIGAVCIRENSDNTWSQRFPDSLFLAIANDYKISRIEGSDGKIPERINVADLLDGAVTLYRQFYLSTGNAYPVSEMCDDFFPGSNAFFSRDVANVLLDDWRAFRSGYAPTTLLKAFTAKAIYDRIAFSGHYVEDARKAHKEEDSSLIVFGENDDGSGYVVTEEDFFSVMQTMFENECKDYWENSSSSINLYGLEEEGGSMVNFDFVKRAHASYPEYFPRDLNPRKDEGDKLFFMMCDAHKKHRKDILEQI